MAKIESGEVRFTPDGRGIRRRTYLRDHRGLPPTTLWVDLEETGHNRQAKYELRGLFPGVSTSQLFATPKPERLMKKILEVATRPGDIVLDAFAGSGTTAAVAHKLGRRWVAIERSADTISRFTLPRLQQVIDGSDQGGVSTVTTNVSESEAEGVRLGEGKIAARVIEAMAKAEELPVEKADVVALVKALRARDRTETNSVWAGGGGIRVLRVASSMFDAEGGMVFLADAMANGRLAEATAAQLGFSYEVEPPFSGRKGRARLAVIDGVVNEGVVKLLVVALAEGERVVVCGTGIDPDARTLLKELAPGSTLRKIPAALLDRYRASESAARRTRATVGTATTGQS
jgi:adenine-specific DNA-methyltransferase